MNEMAVEAENWGFRLTLHRWRRHLNNLHRALTQLIPQTENEGVQGSLGGRVSGHPGCGDYGEVGCGAVLWSVHVIAFW